MKFSIALESTRAIVSALLALKCMYNLTVIDFHADIYTFESSLCLICYDLLFLFFFLINSADSRDHVLLFPDLFD
jgi:hypothetical protein